MKISISPSKSRIEELDFLKGVLILFVVAFHLAYIGNTYPIAKQWVYTFHMPGFLLVSGYLFNRRKCSKRFVTSMIWLAIPYLIMETGYVVMASLLPIRDHVDHLTPLLLLRKITIAPLGPYWYLHTLVVCEVTAYLTFHTPHVREVSRYILLALLYLAMAQLHVVSFANAMYFLGGIIIRLILTLSSISHFGSWIAVVPLVLLSLDPQNYGRGSLTGVAIVLSICSLIIWLSSASPRKPRLCILYIGRNTLPIYLFSPIFTILAKFYLPLMLRIDVTGLLFMVISVAFAVAGSILITAIMDKTGFSRMFFGKSRQLQ